MKKHWIFLFSISILSLQPLFSQVEKQKADFQRFRDSCNIELDRLGKMQDFDGMFQTLHHSLSEYKKLHPALQQELDLEGGINYAIARLYSYRRDENNTLKYLKKAVETGFKDYSWWQNSILLPEKENETINNELIKLGEIKIKNHPDSVLTPWYLTHVWTHLKSDLKFEKLEIDFSILTDIPDYMNLYIAPFTGAINGLRFYGGIQTNEFGGKNMIFSRWNERDLRAIRKQPAGEAVSSGDEGDFISVRHPYKWAKGRYKITLAAGADTLMLQEKNASLGNHENLFLPYQTRSY